jgi:hypothetical protein
MLTSSGVAPLNARAAERVVQLQIAKRRLQHDPGTIRVTAGDYVELRWRTDEATTLHLHGYDLMLPLAPGDEARMRFQANATGRYPVSAHGFGDDTGKSSHREIVLLYLEVYPR